MHRSFLLSIRFTHRTHIWFLPVRPARASATARLTGHLMRQVFVAKSRDVAEPADPGNESRPQTCSTEIDWGDYSMLLYF